MQPLAMFDIDAALRYLIQAEGSDLHLKVPAAPTARVHGHLSALEGEEPLKPPDTERVLRYMLTDPSKLDEFDREGEVDFAYSIEGLARFRVNAFRQRGSISLVCRAIPYSIRTVEQLNLPDVIRTLAEEERGIVLLTGTTGSGKSTTLAAMIDHMNQTMAKHVVTIEDPIEYLHRDRKSVINQREVGLDTTSFKRALRRVLRQDPDVILIGEMRDEETVQTALSAAETGHLVLSTVHTVDATESINRMLDFFPPHQHQQARAMIAGTLKGVVSQRLIPSADGGGRVAVCEILVMTGRVRDMIMDPTQTGRLHEVIQEGEYYGMQTFDQALLGHLQAGRITMEEAVKASTHPHDFKLLVAAEGRRSTSMADIVPPRGAGEDEPTPAPTPPIGNGNGHEPAPVTPLAPVAPEGEPQDPPVKDPPPPPPPPPAASNEGPASTGSVPPPGAA
jgi:twitching motility protein PilT